MPNSRHSDAIVSPSLSRITNRIRSSMTELSFHGILLSAPFGPKSVTHVSGTFCYPCLGTDNLNFIHRVESCEVLRLGSGFRLAAQTPPKRLKFNSHRLHHLSNQHSAISRTTRSHSGLVWGTIERFRKSSPTPIFHSQTAQFQAVPFHT